MGVNLTNLYIDETFEKLTQISGSKLTDGLGNDINLLNITASYALNSVPQVSASYATSASHALNADNSISSSYSVTAVSSSYSNTSTSASHAIAADTSILADTASLLIGNAEQVSHIDFAVGGDATVERRLTWNDTDGTLNVGLKGGNVTLQVGQEEVARVVNGTGTNLLEAQYRAVKVIGAQGQRLQVDFAQANSDINSATTLGLVTENINNNQEGFITTQGTVNKINTTGALQGENWNDGDVLYLSATTPGVLTNVKPLTPAHLIVIGFVEYAHQNNGKIYVKVDNGYELEELHDVLITNPTNGEALVYENGIWINSDVPHISASYAVSSSQAEKANGVVNTPSLGSEYMLTGNSGDDTVYRTNVLISGSNAIQANGGFFGNLTGNADTATSASYALTASYALNAGAGDSFPYTGSAIISGSLTVIGQSTVNGSFNQNIIDTGSDSFRVGNNDAYLNMAIGGFGPPENYQVSSFMTFGGADETFFNSQGNFNIANINPGTGSINVRSENNLNLTSVGGDIDITADNNIKQQVGSTTAVLSDFGSTFRKFQSGSIAMSFNSFNGNSQPTMYFDGVNSYFQATNNMAFENAPGGQGSGSMDFRTNGNLTFLTPNYNSGVDGGNILFQANSGSIALETGGDINVQGKAFAYSISSNINGFSIQVDQDTFVRDNQRAFVETPLIIGTNGSVTVGTNSTLKVINEL